MRSLLGLILGWGGAAMAAETWMLAAPPTVAAAEITIRAGHTVGSVNPLVFGHNLEAADSRGIFEPLNGDFRRQDASLRYGQGFWDPKRRASFSAVQEQMRKLRLSMLRYPGGCLAHNFDWRKTVGPPAGRPDWPFGLDEYLRVCRELQAEPMITVTDYALPAAELPRHAAELVEYLNAPATPEHPWAMKRMAWGHAEPYGVKWFELGNESYHGNHDVVPGRRFTPGAYAAYATAVAAAMRAVDPSIKLGIVGYEPAWDRVVFREAGPVADFVIIHLYGPPMFDGIDIAQNIQVTMSHDSRTQASLDAWHRMIREACGRDLPLAVTEYNVGPNHNWRYTFLAGLANADLMRLFLEPRNRIGAANYWQILNGYWGIAGTAFGDRVVSRSAPLTFFETWARYCGSTVVETVVRAPLVTIPDIGGWGASMGTASLPQRTLPGALDLGAFTLKEFERAGVSATIPDKDALTVTFNQCDQQLYASFAVVHRPSSRPPGQVLLLKVSFEARVTPAAGQPVAAVMGLGLCDLRGWEATKSAMAVSVSSDAQQWQTYEGFYGGGTDCPGVSVLSRLENISGKFSGTVEYRNIKLQFYQPSSHPAFPGVTALATVSEDGKKMYLVAFNKDFQTPMTTRIAIDGFKTRGGTFLELYRKDVTETAFFTGTPGTVTMADGGFVHTLPPHSMTAFELVAE